MVFVGGIVTSVVAAAVTCIPPSDFHSFSLGIPNTPLSSVSATRVAASLAGPWRGLFPIPVGVGRWNTNMLDNLPAAVWVQAALGLALVVLVAAALRARPFRVPALADRHPRLPGLLPGRGTAGSLPLRGRFVPPVRRLLLAGGGAAGSGG